MAENDQKKSVKFNIYKKKNSSEIGFGYGSLQPKCLQKPLNNAKAFLCFLTLANIVQGISINGLLKVNVTSIERRFHLLSSESGLIISAYDIAGCLALLPITYLGGNGHKPRWIGIGLLVTSVGFLMLTLPHFLGGQYVYSTSMPKNQDTSCINNSISNITDQFENVTLRDVEASEKSRWLKNMKYIFIFGQFLNGIGSTPLAALSLTFLDDSVDPVKYPAYIGVYYMGALIGPAFGFIIGGKLLLVFTDIQVSPDDITVDSPQWVGAWWVGFLLCSLAMVLLAIPVLAYPKNLPSTYTRRRTTVNFSVAHRNHSSIEYNKVVPSIVSFDLHSAAQMETSANTDCNVIAPDTKIGSNQHVCSKISPQKGQLHAISVKHIRKGVKFKSAPHKSFLVVERFFRDLVLVLSNKAFIFLSLSAAVSGTLVSGFSTFGPKFIEAQFGKSSSEAANLFGYIFIPAGTVGLVVGSFVMSGLKLLHKKALMMCLTVSIVGLFIQLALVLYCPNVKVAGINILYDDQMVSDGTPDSLKVSCNQDCNCNNVTFDPVCGSNDITYFSSCFAACHSRNTTMFSNCSCIKSISTDSSLNTNDKDIAGGKARAGSCPVVCKWQSVIYASLFILGFTTFLCATPGSDLSLRCFDHEFRSLSVGIQWILIRTLGNIPGPIIFGAMIDNTCLIWNRAVSGSESRGSCAMYKNQELSYSAFTLSMIYKGATVLFFGAALLTYFPASLAETEHETADRVVEESSTTTKKESRLHKTQRLPPVPDAKRTDNIPHETDSTLLVDKTLLGAVKQETSRDNESESLVDYNESQVQKDLPFQPQQEPLLTVQRSDIQSRVEQSPE